MDPRKPEPMMLDRDEEDCMVADGYRRNERKFFIVWLCIGLSGGILGILFYCKPAWYAKATSSRTTTETADTFVIQGRQKIIYVCRVHDASEKPKSFAYSKVRPALRFKRRKSTANPELQLIVPDPSQKGEFQGVDSYRYFDCKCERYIWNPLANTYDKLGGLTDLPLGYFLAQSGLDKVTRSQRLSLFGLNTIQANVQTYFEIFVRECLTFFHIFQLFSVILWFCQLYWPFAFVVAILSALSLAFQVFVSRRQQINLRGKLEGSCEVQIEDENGRSRNVDSDSLIPGDILLINSKIAETMMRCDAVLISGYCIVNESSLSGQSIPMRKEPVSNSNVEEKLDPVNHRHHFLFSGTRILQASGGIDGRTRAIVVRTGFMTGKGELTRNIMFFHTADIKFERQTFWYIFALSILAGLGMIYSIIAMVRAEASSGDIAIRALNLITIIVPPVLPIALTFGIIFAQYRLLRQKIACTGPHAINMCGLIDLCCFDKTGTLTVDGLDLKGLFPITLDRPAAEFLNPADRRYSYCDIRVPIVRAIAACQSLVNSIPPQPANKRKSPMAPFLVGDPLEIVMFNSIHWRLVEKNIPGFGSTKFKIVYPGVDITFDSHEQPQEKKYVHHRQKGELIVLREFPFTETLQRMGTIAYNTSTNQPEYYQKGAPEVIVNFCNPSTVPADFTSRLNQVMSQGFRVIALAWKTYNDWDLVSLSKLTREEADTNLEFIGFVAFENRIKPDSALVIDELNKANIRTVMLTGDNIHTAISVARGCGMVRPDTQISVVMADEETVKFIPRAQVQPRGDVKRNESGRVIFVDDSDVTESILTHTSLALTGKTLEIIKKFHPNILPKILLQGTVFARMTPTDKEYIVQQFQRVNYKVAMCGDGANDCQALRAAHAGISLTDSESAASADFTSTDQGLACVPTLLREGRCALLTFIGTFFFMETYSMCQFANSILLFWLGKDLTNWQGLYQDLFEATILVIVVASARPYPELSSRHIPSTLQSFPAIFALIGHIFIILIAQIIAFATAGFIACPTTAMALKTNLLIFSNSSSNSTDSEPDRLQCGMENYGVWSVGIMQIVFLSFIFAKGPPFRLPFYSNYLHLGCAVVLIVFNLVCILRPTADILVSFEMTAPSSDHISYRWAFVFISLGYLLFAVGFEQVIVDRLVTNCVLHNKKFQFLREVQKNDVENDLWNMVQSLEISKQTTFHNEMYSPEDNSNNKH